MRPSIIDATTFAAMTTTAKCPLFSPSSELPFEFVTVNPCGNFSDTSKLELSAIKGSIGHTFMVCIHTENQNQGNFYPFVLLEISVLHELPLGHLRYSLTDVPPQPNSPSDHVFDVGHAPKGALESRRWDCSQSYSIK